MLTNEQKLNSGLDMAFLVACGLNDVTPNSKQLENMDFETVYKQSERHKVQAIAYLPLKSYRDANGCLPTGLSETLFNEWEKIYKNSVRRVFSFAVEREKLLRFMEENGIWYMPMKGIVLQEYYPKFGMRQMVDNDILFDRSRRRDVRRYMVESGYEVCVYDFGVHDIYKKSPYFNFEMHAYLYRESVNDVFDRYYQNVFDRLVKDASSKYGYRFSPEDFYVHIITHIFKHYEHGGVGIKFLADVFVYLKAEEEKLNFDYIGGELEKLDISDFEKRVRAIAKMLFSKECINLRAGMDSLTDEQKNDIELFVSSGAYGTKERALDKHYERVIGSGEKTLKGKIKFLYRRLFPDMLYYKEYYEFAYKYKILIPFVWIYRTFKGIVFKTKSIISEIKLLNKK